MGSVEPTAAQIDRMSSEEYRRYIQKQTKGVQPPVKSGSGLSVRERAERLTDVPEDPTREIVRSSRHSGMTQAGSSHLSTRQLAERKAFDSSDAKPAPVRSEQLDEGVFRTSDDFNRQVRQHQLEETARRERVRAEQAQAKADSEIARRKQAADTAAVQKARWESEFAERERQDIFHEYQLTDNEIREVMNDPSLAPEDFSDTTQTHIRFLAIRISEHRGQR